MEDKEHGIIQDHKPVGLSSRLHHDYGGLLSCFNVILQKLSVSFMQWQIDAYTAIDETNETEIMLHTWIILEHRKKKLKEMVRSFEYLN